MIPFTESKTKVRELNLKAMQKCLTDTGEGWAYFGLPSPKMEDVLTWKEHLRSVDAVERGTPGLEWKSQHELARTAMLNGIRGFTRHRGDIDDVILTSERLSWEFDVVNLDYTGGITYKDEQRHSKRVEALRSLIHKQAQRRKQFFLIITVNDRHHDGGEINRVLSEMIERAGTEQQECAERLKTALADKDQRRAAMFYTKYVVLGTGQQWFKIEVFRPILYTGRKDYRMLNMTFCFKPVPERDAPISVTYDLSKMCAKAPIIL